MKVVIGGIALIKFNRPARLNAWTPDLRPAGQA